jgi:hypothetical protein
VRGFGALLGVILGLFIDSHPQTDRSSAQYQRMRTKKEIARTNTHTIIEVASAITVILTIVGLL